MHRYVGLISSSSSSSSSFFFLFSPFLSHLQHSFFALWAAVVPIFHAGCICDLCVNRNESAERFPPAFNIPLRSSTVCRYHSSSRTPICSKTRLKRLARQRQNTQTCALIRRRCKGGERFDVAGLPPALRGPGGRADRDRRPALRHRQPAGRPGQSCETNQDESLPFVF